MLKRIRDTWWVAKAILKGGLYGAESDPESWVITVHIATRHQQS